MREAISVTIITLNEETNVPRAIQSVSGWANEIIVVDCGSNDRTAEVAEKLGAKVFKNQWKGYGQQKNFAQQQAKNDWVLNIDADEAVTPELKGEIDKLLSRGRNGSEYKFGYAIPRKTYFLGAWIKNGGWYPNYLTRFANKKHAQWSEPHVHEALIVEGGVGHLENPLIHYTFESIEDQVLTNIRYSRAGYLDMYQKGKRASLTQLIFKPIGKFVETYFLKRGFLDGIRGFIISVNAAHSMFLKYAYFFEDSLKKKAPHENSRH